MANVLILLKYCSGPSGTKNRVVPTLLEKVTESFSEIKVSRPIRSPVICKKLGVVPKSSAPMLGTFSGHLAKELQLQPTRAHVRPATLCRGCHALDLRK